MEQDIITDNSEMPFGKYAKKEGKPAKRMIDVPAFYLLYIYENNYIPLPKYQNVKQYIINNWNALLKEVGRYK